MWKPVLSTSQWFTFHSAYFITHEFNFILKRSLFADEYLYWQQERKPFQLQRLKSTRGKFSKSSFVLSSCTKLPASRLRFLLSINELWAPVKFDMIWSFIIRIHFSHKCIFCFAKGGIKAEANYFQLRWEVCGQQESIHSSCIPKSIKSVSLIG